MKTQTRLALGLVPVAVAMTTIITVVLAPLSVLPRLTSRLRAAHDQEAGVSEIAVIALVTGLAAILVVAYMAIVSTKVENEANNLPTSGG